MTVTIPFVFQHPGPFVLESGKVLQGYHLAYHTYGVLNPARDNVVWVFHALTANSDPQAWWPGLVGPGCFFDPAQYFIVCVNMPGSCYGSIGPLEEAPDLGRLFYHDFPFFSIRDMIRAYRPLRDALGIRTIRIGVGGSMGGQQLLEWAVAEPDAFDYIIPIATNAWHSAWGNAFNESQRWCIEADPSWKEASPLAGIEGMKIARSVALLSYRSYHTYELLMSDESGGGLSESSGGPSESSGGLSESGGGLSDSIGGGVATDASGSHALTALGGSSVSESSGRVSDSIGGGVATDSGVSSYQRYQGEKLARRFNAFSYYQLSRSMDSHHVGRDRAGNAAGEVIGAAGGPIGATGGLIGAAGGLTGAAGGVTGAAGGVIGAAGGVMGAASGVADATGGIIGPAGGVKGAADEAGVSDATATGRSDDPADDAGIRDTAATGRSDGDATATGLSAARALARIRAKAFVIGLRSDMLFPLSEQQFLARHIPGARFTAIDSDYGHDGFLLEAEAIGKAVKEFLDAAILPAPAAGH